MIFQDNAVHCSGLASAQLHHWADSGELLAKPIGEDNAETKHELHSGKEKDSLPVSKALFQGPISPDDGDRAEQGYREVAADKGNIVDQGHEPENVAPIISQVVVQWFG